jgi:hypothetical protein
VTTAQNPRQNNSRLEPDSRITAFSRATVPSGRTLPWMYQWTVPRGGHEVAHLDVRFAVVTSAP